MSAMVRVKAFRALFCTDPWLLCRVLFPLLSNRYASKWSKTRNESVLRSCKRSLLERSPKKRNSCRFSHFCQDSVTNLLGTFRSVPLRRRQAGFFCTICVARNQCMHRRSSVCRNQVVIITEVKSKQSRNRKQVNRNRLCSGTDSEVAGVEITAANKTGDLGRWNPTPRIQHDQVARFGNLFITVRISKTLPRTKTACGSYNPAPNWKKPVYFAQNGGNRQHLLVQILSTSRRGRMTVTIALLHHSLYLPTYFCTLHSENASRILNIYVA